MNRIKNSILPAIFLAIGLTALATRMTAASTPVINCTSGFASSGTCGVSLIGGSGQALAIVGAQNGSTPGLSGSQVNLAPTGATHTALALNYQTKVNVQAFTSTFEFVPNGWTLAFVLQNNTVNAQNPAKFSAGAGCEGGFYQAFGGPPPNNIFALMLDQQSDLTDDNGPHYGTPFTYSSVQIYQEAQSPCNPNDTQPDYYQTNKISTFPVPLNSPANAVGTITGDKYSVTLNYTGTNLVMNMYDTASGSCPGSSCFTYIWDGINIPALVGKTTAFVGLTEGTNQGSTHPLYINSLTYTVLSPADTPAFSPVAGSYAGAQSVTISDFSSGAIICYNITGSPATNGTTGCANGMRYTGAISVPSGQTIYAVAGGTGYGDSTVNSAAYKIGTTASQPTFSPASGSYNGNQTVTLSAAQGNVICYNTMGAPTTNGSTGCTSGTLYMAPITVSSNETLYAAAGGTGLTNSAVGSSAYTINPYAGAAPANSPTYSPLPGSYAGTQSITLKSTTASSYICYTLAASPSTLLPQTDNEGGCITGTLYSGPISVSSTQNLYAMASTPRLAPPSSLTVGTYIIGGVPLPPPLPPPTGLPNLFVGAVTGTAGSRVTLPVNLIAGTTGVSALQFTIGIPSGWSLVSASTGVASLSADDVVVMNSAKGIVLIYDSKDVPSKVIASGIVANLVIQIPSSAAVETDPITISGEVYSDPSGANVTGSASTNGSVTVQAGTAVLSECGTLSVRVYPNPWRKDKHAGHPITFDQMPANCDVKIFTISGHKVKELNAPSGSVTWELTTDSGDRVASGIYIYLIKDSQGNTLKGKVAVIQ